MRKSSVGSAVLGLLAVTVASIGATGVLMLLPFSNDRALFGCAGAITAVLYFGYGRWIGSRQSAKTAGLVMILAAAVQVLWLVVLYGAVPEWLLGIAGCALPAMPAARQIPSLVLSIAIVQNPLNDICNYHEL